LGLTDARRGPKKNVKSITEAEEKKILSVLTSEEYCNDSPDLIVAKLADRGEYLCSQASMYRILRRHKLNKYRRRGKVPVREEKISTLATQPNQVWTWDITYMRSWIRGEYFKLYAYEDLYSRKIVGWHVDEIESEKLSESVFLKALKSEKISGKNLRVHNDNGNVMKAFTFVEKLKDLGVVQSFSRPSVSNDNPFIESFFKTMKYAPQYPYKPFKNVEEANVWVEKFISWYNEKHLHSSLSYTTPNQRHTGADEIILSQRRKVYKDAKSRNPIRWAKNCRKWESESETRLPKNSCRKTQITRQLC
jgi:putative transposase